MSSGQKWKLTDAPADNCVAAPSSSVTGLSAASPKSCLTDASTVVLHDGLILYVSAALNVASLIPASAWNWSRPLRAALSLSWVMAD